MRSITIDFTKSPVEISSTILGRKGENNATQLVITPPAEMSSEDSGVVCYSVAFQIGANRKKHSAVYAKAETITVPLERAVTQVNVLSLQLEGYDGEENLIMKSERIDNLLFDASVDGDEYNGEGESNLGAQVAAHEAKLSRPTATVETTDTETFGIELWQDAPIGDGFAVVCNDTTLIPAGTEIKTIEFKIGADGEWVDIHRLYEVDSIPYHLNMERAIDYDGVNILAVICKTIYGENFLHMAVINGWDSIYTRITYYTDYLGGENYA